MLLPWDPYPYYLESQFRSSGFESTLECSVLEPTKPNLKAAHRDENIMQSLTVVALDYHVSTQ